MAESPEPGTRPRGHPQTRHHGATVFRWRHQLALAPGPPAKVSCRSMATTDPDAGSGIVADQSIRLADCYTHMRRDIFQYHASNEIANCSVSARVATP